jgi:hypothetical protein
VPWVSLRRPGEAEGANVPLTDQARVVRQCAGGYRLWQTHREALRGFWRDSDKENVEHFALARFASAAKFPLGELESTTAYEDFQPSDFNLAVYAALQMERELAHSIVCQKERIDELLTQKRSELEGLQARALTRPTAVGPLDAQLIPLREFGEMHGVQVTERDKLLVRRATESKGAVDPQVLSEIAATKAEIDVFEAQRQDFDTQVEYLRGVPRPWRALGTDVSNDAYSLASSMDSPFAPRHLQTSMRLDRGDAASPPRLGDGLASIGDWIDIDEERERVRRAFDAFREAYYGWAVVANGRLQSSKEAVQECALWMQTLRDRGFAYVAVMLTDAPAKVVTATCFSKSALDEIHLGPPMGGDAQPPPEGYYNQTPWIRYHDSASLGPAEDQLATAMNGGPSKRIHDWSSAQFSDPKRPREEHRELYFPDMYATAAAANVGRKRLRDALTLTLRIEAYDLDGVDIEADEVGYGKFTGRINEATDSDIPVILSHLATKHGHGPAPYACYLKYDTTEPTERIGVIALSSTVQAETLVANSFRVLYRGGRGGRGGDLEKVIKDFMEKVADNGPGGAGGSGGAGYESPIQGYLSYTPVWEHVYTRSGTFGAFDPGDIKHPFGRDGNPIAPLALEAPLRASSPESA